jgi:hypothetical protein
MLVDSARFPLQGDGAIKRLLVGTGLTILLVIPLVNLIVGLFLNGYFLRTVRAGAAGDPPPSFDDAGGLLRDGGKLFVTLLVWAIPSILVVVVGFLAIFATLLSAPSTLAAGAAGAAGAGAGAGAGETAGLLALLGLVVTLLVGAIPFYFVPAAVLGVATQDRISAGFQLGAIRDVAFSTEYLVGMVVVALIVAVVQFLNLIIVGIPLVFYFQMVLAHFVGQMGARAAERNRAESSPTAAPA